MRSRVSTSLLFLLLVCNWHVNAQVSKANAPGNASGVVGDANHDGVFDRNDVTLVEKALRGDLQLDSDAVRLSNVAEPCDGRLTSSDLERLKKASCDCNAGKAVFSACHHLLIGADLAAEEVGPGPTIDEQFAAIAQSVPGFGGIYLQSDGKLAVVLQNPTPESLKQAEAEIVRTFGPARIPKAGLIGMKAEFSFTELDDAHEKVRALLAIPGVLQIDTDEVQNRVVIGLQSLDLQKAVQQELAKLQVKPELIRFAAVKPVSMFQTPLSSHDLRHTVRPLIGGVQISFGNFVCSLGFIAKRNGIHGFVTADHCSNTRGAVDGTTYLQPDSSNAPIGNETVDPSFFTGGQCPSGRKCRFSDSAFAALLPGITAQRGEIAHLDSNFPFDFDVVGTLNPISGDNVAKVGRTTGISGGQVSHTCVDLEQGDAGKDTGIAMLCQDIADASAEGGDSGAPVFAQAGSNIYHIRLAGVLWGGPDDNSSFDFSPLSAVTNELGSMKVLSADEAPSITIDNPNDGAKVSYGPFKETTFTATTNDFEDGANCCRISWSSNKDGSMGQGNPLPFNFASPGKRTITATATDSGGNIATAKVTVQTSNSPPDVWIVKPVAGQALVRNTPYAFQGASLDGDTWQALSCSNMKWRSSKSQDAGFPTTGCNPQFTFATNGTRTIHLTGTDTQGANGHASVQVDVADPPAGSPPIVSILSPSENQLLQPNNLVQFTAFVHDPDGVSAVNWQWVADTPSGPVILKSGTTAAHGPTILPNFVWVPSSVIKPSCGGRVVPIHLIGQDQHGSSQADVTLHVLYPTC